MRTVRALGVIGVGAAVAAGGLTAPAVAGQVYYVPVTDKVTVRGHGFGHGNGMSQYGAEGAARDGKGYRQILAFYYPGTRLGKMRGRVRVLITADSTSDVKVSPARGLSLRDRGRGKSWLLPDRSRIDRWRILSNGRVQFHNGTRWRRWNVPGPGPRLRGEGEFFAKEPVTLWVPNGGGEVGRRYRGALRSSHGDTVNALSMDNYIRGVVPAEMPASWHLEALKSQAVAARTYATNERSRNRSRYYQTCDTTACQVYGGVGSEYRSTNRAVRQTRREILRYQGEPAFTQFSASSGGWTGDGGMPYLQPQRDPWDDWDGNGVHTWKTRIDTSRLEQRYDALGRLEAIRVVSRNGYGHWGGRVERIRLDGSRNDVHITGDDFRWIFGLRSNWFTIEDTAIMNRWQRLGGRKSRIGRPAGAERDVKGPGSAQWFRRGRIYWHPRIGAREIYGPIRRQYRRMGATRSSLGYPRSGVRNTVRDATLVHFQRGRIYRNPPTGVHVVRFGWRRAYQRAGFERGRLGLPTTDVHWQDGQRRMEFEGGYVFRTRDRKFRVRYR